MGIPVSLPNVTVCFPHIFKPHAAPGSDKEKFSVESLLDPMNPEHQGILTQLDAAYAKVLHEAGKADMIGVFPRPYRTEAEVTQARALKGKGPRPELAGKVLVRASNGNSKPPVVDQNVQPILDQLAIFSGCVCNVMVDVYYYGQSANPGVFCGLNGVQLVNNVGVERLGGGAPSADSMFNKVAGPPANPVPSTFQPTGAPAADKPSWMS